MKVTLEMLIEEIKDRKNNAQGELNEIPPGAHNSYGAGFEQGKYDTCGELLEWIEDEEHEEGKL